MSTLLEAINLQRLDGRYILRRMKLSRKRGQRTLKSTIRRTRSRYAAWNRSQYFVQAAVADTRKSAGRNEDIVISVVMLAAILGYASALLGSEIFRLFFLTAYTFSEVTGTNMLIISSVASATLAALFAWVSALVINGLSIAVWQGANRNKIRSVRRTVRAALSQTTRTTTVWLFFALAILAPLALIGIVQLLYMLFFADDVYEILAVMPLGIVAGFGALLYVLLNYSLAPQVALFEQGLSYKEVFARSRNLVSRRGRMFLLAGYGVVASVMGISYAAAYGLEKTVGIENELTFTILAVSIVIVANCVLTVFYRKRRLARLK